MRVAVIGVGLIGGSVALAARERLGATVNAWDPGDGVLATALRLGAIDFAANSLKDAVTDADAAFLAAPVDALPRLAGEVLAAAPSDCVVTDVGSTKRTVVGAISDPRFVGGHPLAGAETGGVQHARAGMFVGATWFLTPGPDSAPVSTARLRELVTGLGARPQQIDPAAHDRLMAIVSQLPHVFANTLVTELAAHQATTEDETPAFAGPSFKDATRVAGADPALWTEIFLESRDVLAAVLASSIARMDGLRSALVANDRDAVRAFVGEARTASRSLQTDQRSQASEAGGKP